MAQITQGFSYTTSGANSYVTASNLNQHVSLAQLAGGAVVEQTPNSSSNNTDKILAKLPAINHFSPNKKVNKIGEKTNTDM